MKGQVAIPAIIGITAITGLVSSFVGATVNNIVAAPVQASTAISTVQSDVNVLKTRADNQDSAISQITKSVDNINKNIIKLLVKDGVQPAQ